MRRTIAVVLAAVSGSAWTAPPPPAHDIWLEGESCQDHAFTTVGRDPAFAPCYGGAILQLQTQREAPPGGYHATYTVMIPAAGWWELALAATQPSGWNLSPFRLEVSGHRNRRLQGLDAADAYGPGGIFGWIAAGRFHLEPGPCTITIRCDERRKTEGDYLVYIDALALRRIPEPESPLYWMTGRADADEWRLRTALSLEETTYHPMLSVVCDGLTVVDLDGRTIGTVQGWHQAQRLSLGPELAPGEHSLLLRVKPAPGGAVMAWLDHLGPGGRWRTLIPPAAAWSDLGGPAPAPVLPAGNAFRRPYGDMTVQPPIRLAVGRLPIPVKTGNLSVDLIRAAAQGRELPKAPRLGFLDEWRDVAGVSVVEDYICWLPLEPAAGVLRWETYKANAGALRERGMRYAVYPWLHVAPEWARQSGLAESPVCLEHGKGTGALSIWSPRTLEVFDRFYGQLRQAMGDDVAEVFVSMTADYGEVGYPVGMANWVAPSDHIHPGFWCGDGHARQDFRAAALSRYGSLDAVNAAWGTDWAAPEQIGYPPETMQSMRGEGLIADTPASRRRWLDFIAWYHGAMVDFAAKAVGASRRWFPDLPHEIKIGFGAERAAFGADFTAYVARSRQDGYTVRSTHGKLPQYFYRRFSTAAKHYGVPLVTEPPGNVSREEEVARIFKDATSGTAEFFDYPQNLLGATDIFARFGRFMEGRHSLATAAFFFPTTDQRLRPGRANPGRLVAAAEACRDRFDWDIVDERLVRDGALPRYRTLILVEGTVVEADVLGLLREWVAAGGVLVKPASLAIETVAGDRTWDRELFMDARTLPSADVLCPAAGDPLPAAMIDVGRQTADAVLAGDWHAPESGHWEWGGPPDGVRKRWSGPAPAFLFPARPDTEYRLAIAVARHPKRLADRAEVTVNGRPVGSLAPERTSVFQAAIAPGWAADGLLRVQIDTPGWRPADVDGSDDQRVLGVAVRWAKLWEAGAAMPETAPTPRLTRNPDPAALARCLNRLGAGAAIALPVAPDDLAALKACLTILVHEPQTLIPGAVGMPRLDGVEDGIWTALLPNRILLCNGTDRPVERTLAISRPALARLGIEWHGPESVSLRLEPHAIAAVEFPGGQVVTP